jgi:hypothetical protein
MRGRVEKGERKGRGGEIKGRKQRKGRGQRIERN